MLLTIKVKLAPTQVQHDNLLLTMERFNEACNYITKVAWVNQTFGQIKLHKLTYYDVRKKFGLSSQMTVRAIGKVVESYKGGKGKRLEIHNFKLHGAIVYDQRILTVKALDKISILTLEGRIIIPMIIGEYQKLTKDKVRGQADLIYINKQFYLLLVVEVPDESLIEDPDGILGVDLGIVNLAVTSDGEIFSGDECIKSRQKYTALKKRLQPVKTWNAKKHLKRISGKERRFKKDVNHCIAKKIVKVAKDTHRMIALEDLSGIRKSGNTVSKELRTSIGKWAFYELGLYIQYKAQMAGIPVSFVDPKYTSQQCSECGFVSKGNRKTQSEFVCLECGHSENADINAAKNISFRADVNRPIALRFSGLKEESWKGKPTTLVVGS